MAVFFFDRQGNLTDDPEKAFVFSGVCSRCTDFTFGVIQSIAPLMYPQICRHCRYRREAQIIRAMVKQVPEELDDIDYGGCCWTHSSRRVKLGNVS